MLNLDSDYMIYSPTVGLLRLCGAINLNYHSSLMFQIRLWIHGLRHSLNCCTDIINNDL